MHPSSYERLVETAMAECVTALLTNASETSAIKDAATKGRYGGLKHALELFRRAQRLDDDVDDV